MIVINRFAFETQNIPATSTSWESDRYSANNTFSAFMFANALHHRNHLLNWCETYFDTSSPNTITASSRGRCSA